MEIGAFFYSQTIERVVTVSSAKAAELVKVFENTFRAVNIALVNELALLCDRIGLNVWEVLDAAFTKPFGIMPFYPGPGVGGHCIPIDPHYLEWKAREFNFNTHFIGLAGEINRKMPEFVVEKAFRLLVEAGIPIKGAKVLVLGVAYKKDIGDYRESPSIRVIQGLGRLGVRVLYHDPLVPSFKEHGLSMESVPLTREVLTAQDLVIIATDHSSCDYPFILAHAPRVLDTRGVTRELKHPKVTLL